MSVDRSLGEIRARFDAASEDHPTVEAEESFRDNFVEDIGALLEAVDRVRRVADGWSGGPCLTGYRVSDGDDSASECLHCAAKVIHRALDGEAADA